MIKLIMKDDSVEILRDEYDLVDLIEEHMGIDCSRKVLECVEDSNYNNIKVNTDLGVYEEELNEMTTVLIEIQDTVKSLRAGVITADRMNKNKIIKTLETVIDLINNTI